jgi:hypothetical protein
LWRVLIWSSLLRKFLCLPPHLTFGQIFASHKPTTRILHFGWRTKFHIHSKQLKLYLDCGLLGDDIKSCGRELLHFRGTCWIHLQGRSVMLVTSYQTTWCHNQGKYNLNLHHHEHLKSCRGKSTA